MTLAVAIVDLQFGSTGKGNLAAYLGLNGMKDGRDSIKFNAAATNWGPNAGHTAVYPDGEKVVRTMLANSVHRGTVNTVFIGPGSAINIGALADECRQTRDTGKKFKVFVHEHTPVVRDKNREAEKVLNRIGSTQKGTAEAWIDRMRRDPEDEACIAKGNLHGLEGIDEVSVVSHDRYLELLSGAGAVLLEGCQGYSLGLSSGFWPHVTGRECTVAQLLADTLMSPAALYHTIGTARTFPIRVANRFDSNGEMVGWSGPCYSDQHEIQFGDIGQPVEYTTVTKLPRRIFTFSYKQIKEAVWANGVDDIFMNFMNYIPDAANQQAFLDELSNNVGTAVVRYTGHSENIRDIVRRP